MEDDEGARGFSGVGSRRSELEVIEGISQGVHALLASIDGYDHASKVCTHGLMDGLIDFLLTQLSC